VLIEEQRGRANTVLRDGLLPLADKLCSPNCTTDLGPDFFAGLLKNLGPRWPPRGRVWAFRPVLKKVASCGEVCFQHQCPHHACTYNFVVPGKWVRELCSKASAAASGLCLTCVREENIDDGSCEHQEILKQCVENDPLFPMF